MMRISRTTFAFLLAAALFAPRSAGAATASEHADKPLPERISARLSQIPPLSTAEGLDAAVAIEDPVEARVIASVAAIELLPADQAAVLRQGLSTRISDDNLDHIEQQLQEARREGPQNEARLAALAAAVQEPLKTGSASALLSDLDAFYAGSLAEPAGGWRYGDSELPPVLERLSAGPTETWTGLDARRIRLLDAKLSASIVDEAERAHPQGFDRAKAIDVVSREAVHPALVAPFLSEPGRKPFELGTAVDSLAQRVEATLYAETTSVEAAQITELLRRSPVVEIMAEIVDRLNGFIGRAREGVFAQHGALKTDADLRATIAKFETDLSGHSEPWAAHAIERAEELAELGKWLNLEAAAGELGNPGYLALKSDLSSLSGSERQNRRAELEKIVQRAGEQKSVTLRWEFPNGGLRITVETASPMATAEFSSALDKLRKELSSESAGVYGATQDGKTSLVIEWPGPFKPEIVTTETRPEPVASAPVPEPAAEHRVSAHQQELIGLAKSLHNPTSPEAAASLAKRLLEEIRLLDEPAESELEAQIRESIEYYIRKRRMFDQKRPPLRSRLLGIGGFLHFPPTSQIELTREGYAPARYFRDLITAYEVLLEKNPKLANEGSVRMIRSAFELSLVKSEGLGRLFASKKSESDEPGNRAALWTMERMARLAGARRAALAEKNDAGSINYIASILVDTRKQDVRQTYFRWQISPILGWSGIGWVGFDVLSALVLWISMIGNKTIHVGGYYGHAVYQTNWLYDMLYSLWADWWAYLLFALPFAIAAALFLYVGARMITHRSDLRRLDEMKETLLEVSREAATKGDPLTALKHALANEQTAAELGADVLGRLAARVPPPKAESLMREMVVHQGAGYRLKDPALLEAFRELGLQGINDSELLQKWPQDLLAIISDVDPDLFVGLAPQLTPGRELDAMWMIVRDKGGLWALKSPAYQDLFKELAASVPPDRLLPIAADVDPELFLQLAPKASPSRVESVLSDPRRAKLAGAYRKESR